MAVEENRRVAPRREACTSAFLSLRWPNCAPRIPVIIIIARRPRHARIETRYALQARSFRDTVAQPTGFSFCLLGAALRRCSRRFRASFAPGNFRNENIIAPRSARVAGDAQKLVFVYYTLPHRRYESAFPFLETIC